MNKTIYLILVAMLMFACDNTPNISYTEKVTSDFSKRKDTINEARNKALFDVFNTDLSKDEIEALEFLYAYMPLNDLADYDGDFFLKQVKLSLKAKEYFSWGKEIPEEISRHFVLVYRVNNEDLDNSREVFFEELKDRIKDMSMEEAALEVNHWCHEKVTYRGTDGRTSAPLALIKTAWGRCGEEASFTTVALRAVGIPARQCYTPRWVHTDDNHAWVEVWVDGNWKYLGACEPEPELNMAWFNAPVKRAMMVHTNVFGVYTGSEEKNWETPMYSKINVLSNYTETRKVSVKVIDTNGKPLEGVKVSFKVYNYAEYYSIADAITNAKGEASIISGYGDLLVWASNKQAYGYKLSRPYDDLLEIVLNKKEGDAFEDSFELVPPREQIINATDNAKIEANVIRLKYEDSIRNAYMSTFMSEHEAKTFAAELNLDENLTWKYLNIAQGNWQEIQAFIKNNSQNSNVFPFLATLLEKDLRDTPEKTLSEFILPELSKKPSITNISDEMAMKYIQSPRIGLELIRPWRTYFETVLKEKGYFTAPQIISYIKEDIKISNNENYYNCPISPKGVHQLKVSDAKSRNILFVAMCRSIGVPARLNPATNQPEYYSGFSWVSANFDNESGSNTEKGTIKLSSSTENILEPKYSSHYSIARFQDGDFVTLEYSDNPKMNNFPSNINLETGYYRIIVGSRANDGSVTTYNKYLSVNNTTDESFEIKMPKVEGKIQIKGIVDMNTIVTLNNGEKTTLKHLSNNKGVFICFADPGKEPTKHVLQDLPAFKNEFDTWNGGVLFLVPSDNPNAVFNPSVYSNLPENTIWGTDDNRTIMNGVTNTLQMENFNNFPLIILLSNNGGILFSSEGYSIGIGENIIKTIRMAE